MSVTINNVSGPAWGRVFETEVSGPDFDAVLAEAEAMVKRIDCMRDPSIISKVRDDAGNCRMRGRTYSLD